MISEALLFASNKHEGQKDDSGHDYFQAHCMQVYHILSLVTGDKNILCAGLLHDTLEDTKTTYEELERKFGKDIADLVNEVTHEGKKDSVGYTFPRLKTKRGILLKFADRLSNLSRMDCWDEKRRQQYLEKSKFWKSE
jgi:GTP pyrophosphokinase